MTNADVADEVGADVVIIAAPMAMVRGSTSSLAMRLARTGATRRLRNEVAALRAGGAEVLVIAPDTAELAEHGMRLMRPGEVEGVAQAAYEATRRILERRKAEVVLAAARAATSLDRSAGSELSG
jgi:hypothetical protein